MSVGTARILVGTAGWSYPDWEGRVYPPTSTNRLRTVAQYLDCAELDSSFYQPPEPHTTARWVKQLESRPEFRLLAKAWRRFTHERSTPWSRAELELFTRGLEPLRAAGRLDALLFQFPWSFRNEPSNRAWLNALADAFAGWPMAVEIRHDSWLQDEFFQFCRERQIIFCNIDQPTLAHCVPPTAIATTSIGYFRLHGRNAANWFKTEQDTYGGRYDYLYSEQELAGLARHIRQVAAQTQRTFVIFNNHKDAKAFSNALQLKAQLEPGTSPAAPASLLQAFPALRAVVKPVGQTELLF